MSKRLQTNCNWRWISRRWRWRGIPCAWYSLDTLWCSWHGNWNSRSIWILISSCSSAILSSFHISLLLELILSSHSALSLDRKCIAYIIQKVHASQCWSCSEVWRDRTWSCNMQTIGNFFILSFSLSIIKLQNQYRTFVFAL